MPAVTILDSRHHTFLQAVMNRGPLSEKAAITMYKSLVNSTGEGFGEFLLAINKELEFLRLELKKVTNQYDGKGFYGIINSLPSKEAKLGTQFSPAQILFFTAVVEAIVQEPTATGVISSTSAINLKLEPQVSESSLGESPDAVSQPTPKLSMQAKDEAINLLAAEQFLSRTKDGGVALGVKAFLELRSVFRNLEVPFCDICNEAAIKAQLCTTRDCLKRVHTYCVTRGSSLSRNQKPKCSGCETPWTNHLDEGKVGTDEEYVEPIATQDPATPAPVQTSTKARASRKRRATVEDDEEQEEMSNKVRISRKRRALVEDDEEEMSNKARTSRKRRAPVEDDEEEEEMSNKARTSRKRRAPAENDEDEEEEEISSKARTSRKRRAPVEDDDEEEEEHVEANGHVSDEEQPIRSYKRRTERRSGR